LGWLAILLVDWHRQQTPETLAFHYLAFIGCEAILVTAVTIRSLRVTSWFDADVAKRLMRYGLPSGLSSVPQFLSLRLDQLLIAAALPATELGWYVVAVSWSGCFGALFNSIGPVLFQRLAAEQDSDAARLTFGRAVRSSVILSVLVATLLMLITPLMVPLLYGTEFSTATSVAVVLIPAAAVAILNGIIEDGLRGLGDTRSILTAELVGFAATAISLALLLNLMGTLGAAVSSIVGYAATLCSLTIAMRRHEVGVRAALMPRLADLRYVRGAVTLGCLHVCSMVGLSRMGEALVGRRP
jgi:O-antigen/teichoic acid export membrane protein